MIKRLEEVHFNYYEKTFVLGQLEDIVDIDEYDTQIYHWMSYSTDNHILKIDEYYTKELLDDYDAVEVFGHWKDNQYVLRMKEYSDKYDYIYDDFYFIYWNGPAEQLEGFLLYMKEEDDLDRLKNMTTLMNM